MNNIAKIIKKARKAKKITQTELGKEVGLPQSHISKIEAGDINLRLSTIYEITRILDLELVFVPRDLRSLVNAIINDQDITKSAWQPDEEF